MDQDIHLTTSQSVRYRDTIVQFETIILNDIECLLLEDVQQRFPKVTSLCINNTQVAFLRDENGSRLEPQRIKVYKDTVIYALGLEEHQNDDICARLDRIDENMHRMQKTVDLIQANTQETLLRMKQVMVQMYELHEYTTPRYFYILPVDDDKRGAINAVKNVFHLHYMLYFLCECSNEPNQLHVAPHKGYLIKKPKEFIATYGGYIRTTLDVVRVALTVGSIIVPQSDDVPEFVTNTHIPSFDTLDIANVKSKLDTVEELINQAENKIISTYSSVIAKTASQRIPLQGAQL
jgi:hypothetical protein